jgi:hypothetical protein
VSFGTLKVLLNEGDGTFGPATTFPAGADPTRLSLGDMNGDGHLDAVAVNPPASNVSVFRGAGDGTFLPHILYTTENGPSDVVIADLDKDGHLDIATANAAAYPYGLRSASVLINRGDGTFWPHVDYRVHDLPQGIASGDFDRDGDVDLAVVNTTGATVSILLNRGDGTFPRPALTDVGFVPAAIATGRLDADGLPDVAVVDAGANKVCVLESIGGGFFDVVDEQPAGGTPFDVAIADLDGDGLGEVAATSWSDGTVTILWSARKPRRTVHDAGPTAAGIAAADVDADGRMDLVVANHFADEASVLRNLGGGRIGAPEAIPAGARPYTILCADLNGDGAPDLAATSFVAPGGGVNVLFGDSAGSFGAPVFVATGRRAWAIDAADVDGDGDLDLAVINRDDDTVTILANAGDASFAMAREYPVAPYSRALGLGDVSGDGVIDLLAASFERDDLWVRLGASDGTFGEAIAYGGGRGPWDMVIADFDGDGAMEPALAAGGGNEVAVILNQCEDDGDDAPPPAPGTSPAPSPDAADLLSTVLQAWGTCAAPCPADLDGDGAVGARDLLMALTRSARSR